MLSLLKVMVPGSTKRMPTTDSEEVITAIQAVSTIPVKVNFPSDTKVLSFGLSWFS